MTASDSTLLKWLADGGNYGVVVGNGILVVDVDKPKALAQAKKLPPTFTVRTGSDNGHHFYFRSNIEENAEIRSKDANLGHIQAVHKQVVGPGSTHPNGRRYAVSKNNPLAWITRQQISDTFGSFVKWHSEAIEKSASTARRERDFAKISISDLIPLTNFHKSGNEYQGPHPIHGSTTGQNFCVNTTKNVWHCFRHDSGGGPLLWIAVEEGIIKCESAGPKALRGTLFTQVLKKAQERGLIPSCKPGKTAAKSNVSSQKQRHEETAPFLELPDHRLAEQGFDGKNVYFLVYDSKTGKVQKQTELELDGSIFKPIANNEVKNGTVLLPSDIEDYGDERKLLDEIRSFLNRWHEAPDQLSRMLDILYCYLSYIADLIPQLPYRRYLAPWGRGKSAWLETLGWICYRGLTLAGSDTDRSVVRKLNNWRGTAIIDEADFGDSTFYAFIIKILNIGYNNKTGFYHRSDDDNPKRTISYNVYGPKLLATRRKYKDLALESRCMTTIGRQNTTPMPLFRMTRFLNEAQHLRNKLTLWRFRNYNTIKTKACELEDKNLPFQVYGARKISSRVKQVILPLWIIADRSMQQTLIDLAVSFDENLKTADPEYLLELQAKDAVRTIIDTYEDAPPVNIGNVMNVLMQDPLNPFYKIPLSSISRAVLTLQGLKEDQVKTSILTSVSKRLKRVFETNLGFTINISKKRSRVVNIPHTWITEKTEHTTNLIDFAPSEASHKDIHDVLHVHEAPEEIPSNREATSSSCVICLKPVPRDLKDCTIVDGKGCHTLCARNLKKSHQKKTEAHT